MKINTTKTVNELVTILPYIIDNDEGQNNYHSWRVAIIAVLSAKNYLHSKQLNSIFYAALLHDIGGIGYHSHIIHYLTQNDKESRNILLSHPIIGAQLVSDIPQLNPIAKIILDHHEWINGQGYPRAKIGKDISIESQILRIADSIDIALQANRTDKSLEELKKEISLNITKEYSKDLFIKTLDTLEQNQFFHKISLPDNIPVLFNAVSELAGSIPMPAKIDAIGKTLETVAQIIDMKHPFNSGHSLRVCRYAMAIALTLGLNHDEVTSIRWAGLLHDIGKLTVPRRILDKPTGLTPEEYQEVKKHAEQTYKIIGMITTLRGLALMASAHHEHFDGSGYPFGLIKDKIPLEARILAICDAFDAMTSNRPYRIPFTFEEACREIKNFSGKQFDPEIVEYALPLFKNLGF
ncbi:MAG: HD domain-containing phosphohydrolase [Candidatus Omnitrophota bacterium]